MKAGFQLSPLLLAAVATGVLLLAVGGWFHQNARRSADRAAGELREGMQLIDRLRLVRSGAENGVPTGGLAETGFIPRIEAALDHAEVPMSSLRSVTPRFDRSGKVSYRMVLVPVALRPAAEVLQTLVDRVGQGGRVTTLVLRPSDTPAAGAETWRVEAEILDNAGDQP